MIVSGSVRRPAARLRRAAPAGLCLALAVLRGGDGAAARAPGHALVEHPSHAAGWAGLWLQATSDAGVGILGTTPLSPADRAGLRRGDLVVHVDQQPPADPERLLAAVAARRPGEAITLAVQRRDRSLPVTVRLDVAAGPLLAPLSVVGAAALEPPLRGEPRPYLGVQVVGLSEALAPYFRSKPRAGVLVTHVEGNGPAERGGLLAGDVIRSFAGRQVRVPADLRQALTDFGAGQHEVRIVRRGKRRSLRVRLEAPAPGTELPDVGIFVSRRDLEFLRDGLSRGDPEAHRELARLRAETEAVRAALGALERNARAGARQDR